MLHPHIEAVDASSGIPTERKTNVIWRDPPARQGVPGVWYDVLQELMQYPGSWAMIRETDDIEKAYRHTANLRHARLIRIPPGFWEFTARKTETGGEVYGRYLGATPEQMARLLGPRGLKTLTEIRDDYRR